MTPGDANIFPDYILPALKRFSIDPCVTIRCTFAQCIAQLAESALLFLEMSEVLKSDPNADKDIESNLYHITYDSSLKDLQDMIQEDVVALLTDRETCVKKALLSEMPQLCIFFGKQKSNDFLISHIITYLNDPDPSLRGAFCEAIVGIGTFTGTQALEQFILPLLVMALTDAEEMVVEKVINSITSLAELGLIQKLKLKELAGQIVPLLVHPNRWIKYGAVGFVSSISKLLPLIDVKFVIYPMIRPFLTTDSIILTEALLIENLKAPLDSHLYDHAVEYIATEQKKRQELVDADSSESGLLSSLRSVGMTLEDREKITALKFYLGKAGTTRLRDLMRNSTLEPSADSVVLGEHGVVPHTVFLEPRDSLIDVLG